LAAALTVVVTGLAFGSVPVTRTSAVAAEDHINSPVSASFTVTVQPLPFRLLPGSATDIAVGANGAVWVVGTNPTIGGYGIYRWNGDGWTRLPGGAVAIAVDATGNP
jgi:hypothetical protein